MNSASSLNQSLSYLLRNFWRTHKKEHHNLDILQLYLKTKINSALRLSHSATCTKLACIQPVPQWWACVLPCWGGCGGRSGAWSWHEGLPLRKRTGEGVDSSAHPPSPPGSPGHPHSDLRQPWYVVRQWQTTLHAAPPCTHAGVPFFRRIIEVSQCGLASPTDTSLRRLLTKHGWPGMPNLCSTQPQIWLLNLYTHTHVTIGTVICDRKSFSNVTFKITHFMMRI